MMNLLYFAIIYLVIGAMLGGRFVGKNFGKISEGDLEVVLYDFVTRWPIFLAMELSLLIAALFEEDTS